MPLCEQWYQACNSDTFCAIADEDPVSISSLDFCWDSSDGRVLRDITHAENFCWRMGFPVYREPLCYDGVPTASRIRAGASKEEGWKPGASGKTNTAVIAITLIEAIIGFAS